MRLALIIAALIVWHWADASAVDTCGSDQRCLAASL